MWMHRSSAQSPKEDVHAQRMGLGCLIPAQRNEHIRMHQLHLSESGIEHDERPDPRAGSAPSLLTNDPSRSKAAHWSTLSLM
ncbi:hypothetical protein RB195_018693 [Necator americanus]|uniref:Uncharacterized protein n=1 Tax=Necator americanus TaxID=51031 RepID=A0ABR1CCJ3_NECAM